MQYDWLRQLTAWNVGGTISVWFSGAGTNILCLSWLAGSGRKVYEDGEQPACHMGECTYSDALYVLLRRISLEALAPFVVLVRWSPPDSFQLRNGTRRLAVRTTVDPLPDRVVPELRACWSPRRAREARCYDIWSSKRDRPEERHGWSKLQLGSSESAHRAGAS